MLLMVAVVFAQNNTQSPFSKLAYGEMNDNVPGAYRAMGSVGIGMRDNRVINPSQPASFTVVDSTSFMFDLAASGMWDNYSDAGGTRNVGNGNLEYLALQFPIWKRWIGMSVGVLPYSVQGYQFSLSDSINSHYHYSKDYVGEGGITQVYAGLSFNICDWFAVGANAYYMFGDLTNERSISFEDQTMNNEAEISMLDVRDWRFRYGAQLFHQFDKCYFSLGAIFENKSKLNSDFYHIETLATDTIEYVVPDCELPMVWGVGAMFNYGGRFMFSADYTRHGWGSVKYYDASQQLQDRYKLALGFEYTHNPFGRRYVDHMPWRIGFSMANSYVSSIPSKEYIVSMGTAFPLHNVATVINTSLEYGHRGNHSTINENFIRFTLNVAVNENWFFKRRL